MNGYFNVACHVYGDGHVSHQACSQQSVDSSVPSFGERQRGEHYIPRPGAYAVISGPTGEMAVVRYRSAYFLPGGGINSGEMQERCLHREVEEEIGWTIRIGSFLGTAHEYVYAEEERSFYNKIGHFFTASLVEQTPTSPEHELAWLARPDAEHQLAHASHVWAVKRAGGLKTA